MEVLERLDVDAIEDEWERVGVLKLRNLVERDKAFPGGFVEEFGEAVSSGLVSWKEAREKNDFGVFEPHLKKIVELRRKESEYLNFDGHIYNGLLNKFEEGSSVEKLEVVFEKLKSGLLDLLGRIKASFKYKEQVAREYVSDEVMNRKLCERVIDLAGIPGDRFRLDFSESPFVRGIGRDDVRMAVNFKRDVLKSLSSSFHEIGHALYELNLPRNSEFLFSGEPSSFGMNEGQARFWQSMIGKNEYFQKYFFSEVHEVFGLDVDFDEWYGDMNLVSEGSSRVFSDEVHYCLHVIMRFELEKVLIEGSLEVCDLPKVWREKTKEYFGVDVRDDNEGVLQDIHWARGVFGFFPSYALGSVYASQLYARMVEDVSGVESDLLEGKLGKVVEWLGDKVYSKGALQLTEDLVEDVCGEGLNVDVYLDYLRVKYSEIYDLVF